MTMETEIKIILSILVISFIGISWIIKHLVYGYCENEERKIIDKTRKEMQNNE